MAGWIYDGVSLTLMANSDAKFFDKLQFYLGRAGLYLSVGDRFWNLLV